MNDRFKFRVWDKINSKWVERCLLDIENGYLLGYYDNQQAYKRRYAIMQSTGLKDKNGKLIYELDYVRYANNKYKVEIDKFLGISLTNILNGDTIVMDDIVLFNCEVIGNEFESNTKI